jgi:hypothetical protein
MLIGWYRTIHACLSVWCVTVYKRQLYTTGHDADTYYPSSTPGSLRCISELKYWTKSLFSDLCIVSYSFSWPLIYACANHPLIWARPSGQVSTIKDRKDSHAVEGKCLSHCKSCLRVFMQCVQNYRKKTRPAYPPRGIHRVA